MILRFFGPNMGIAVAAIVACILGSPVIQAAGPDYTYVGISYEWTDVKYGANPKVDDRYNNGTLEGENINFSLGILSWLHIQGQAFGFMDGTCKNCNTDPTTATFDADMEALKIGIGINLSLDKIGLSETADLVLRGNYVDTEVSNLNITSPSTISDNGWSAEAMIRGQISDRADVQVGYEYFDQETKNRNVSIGLNYRVYKDVSVLARGIIFDSETGLELGVNWQFGNLLFGRDSMMQ